jgi:hypothetical protein
MYRKRNIRSSELGIDIGSLQERELFRWFLACLLFGKPIQQEIAQRAFLQLDQAGLDSPQAILDAGWDRLVDLLDRAHYVRYDFSTASKLLDVCNALTGRYGALKQVIAQSATPAQLAETLQEFKGIGPVTTRIFIREIRPIWHALKLEQPPSQKARVTRKEAALKKRREKVFAGARKEG